MSTDSNAKTRRSRLSKTDAQKHYISIGELVAVEQIQKDSALLADRAIPVGPFARLDANLVAARDGKSRGAITNLFGSQASFQAETMAFALNAAEWVKLVVFPPFDGHPTADAWFDALLLGQSQRGPVHGAKPVVDDGFIWALWLSAVPYGLWSEEVSRPSLDEHVLWVKRLEKVIGEALDHFKAKLREGVSLNDLACATASMIEGVWLNQCLSRRHPCDPAEPIATVLRRSGALLWRGAVESLDSAS